jgi:peptidoglycan/xylan/chitin deacetylase (PgdA/CDA1 family)
MLAALSFDDGPDAETTPYVLDVLEQYHIPASFFLIGRQITDDMIPLVRRETELGCSIECHSWSHVKMTALDAAAVREEISRTDDRIESITGRRPVFFRPPYIDVSDALFDEVDKPFICGMGVEDWVPSVSAAERSSRIVSGVQDGTIILLHDRPENRNTPDALETAVPELLARGYEFVTVPQIFERSGVNPRRHHKIWSNVFQ